MPRNQFPIHYPTPKPTKHLSSCPSCDPTPFEIAMGKGRLKIGDIICDDCEAGPYLVWCNENNIPKKDR